MQKLMYITGSFPRLGDGIGDAAGHLYEAFEDKDKVLLVTLDADEINAYVHECSYKNVTLVKDWKLKSVNYILGKIKKEHIPKVLIEYAGNGYRRDLAISFLPLRIRIYNIFSKEKIECHVRLHEFSMCRVARKIFTYPLVLFCHHLDTPSYVEYNILKKKFGTKVSKSAIGSNINWRTEKKAFNKKTGDKIKLAFFGGIYPGKGIEELIEIWGDIEKKYPDKYEFQLLGGYPEGLTNVFDDYKHKVWKLIEANNLNDKIKVSGFLPENKIEEELDKVDIAILPYQDGLTLRRGSFLAFLGRNVAVVTSKGDAESYEIFKDALGVKMCSTKNDMINEIINYSIDNKYYEAGCDNAQYEKYFNWKDIAQKVISCFGE